MRAGTTASRPACRKTLAHKNGAETQLRCLPSPCTVWQGTSVAHTWKCAPGLLPKAAGGALLKCESRQYAAPECMMHIGVCATRDAPGPRERGCRCASTLPLILETARLPFASSCVHAACSAAALVCIFRVSPCSRASLPFRACCIHQRPGQTNF